MRAEFGALLRIYNAGLKVTGENAGVFCDPMAGKESAYTAITLVVNGNSQRRGIGGDQTKRVWSPVGRLESRRPAVDGSEEGNQRLPIFGVGDKMLPGAARVVL